MEKLEKLNAIVQKVNDLFKSHLELEQVANDANFLDLGGDSLSVMNLIVELEAEYGVTLDPRYVLADPTPEKIAGIIMAKLDKRKDYSAIEVNLYEEAVLEKELKMQRKYKHKANESKNIFLTGATGFLGAFLVKDLLESSSDVKLYCLVRCPDKYDGLERIFLNMRKYGVWKKEYKKRIEVVVGNLVRTHYAVDDEKWAWLCENMDAVYHNGAMLNFLYPYAAMRSSNVKSTLNALRLAMTGKAKYFNFVSSYSVYDNPSHFGKTVMEDDEFKSAEGYFLGYSETKWVAEKLVNAAKQRGLRTFIYRPGDITGTKETGVWQARDLTSRMIIGCIQMKVVPIVDMPMNFTPVDYVSKAIVHISLDNNNMGKAYNIINPEIGPSTELVKAIYACKKFVMPIPYSVWKSQLGKADLGGNSLKILESMFKDKGDNAGDIMSRHQQSQPKYNMINTQRALMGSGIKCDPMDADLLKSYIKYFIKAGLI